MTDKPIDTHAHLNLLTDPEKALHMARRAGLSAVVGVGMDLDSNRRILELAEVMPDLVWPALGAHPYSLTPDNWPENLDFIEKNLGRAVALGEVGLDFEIELSPDFQRQVLAEVLSLAASMNKPALVHDIASEDICLKMLQQAGITRAVFHWYSGPLDLLDRILTAGYLVSATPALAYSQPHQAVINHTRLSKILVETDCPVNYQGQPSQPADVLGTINLLAEMKGLKPSEVAAVTAKTAHEFFGRE